MKIGCMKLLVLMLFAGYCVLPMYAQSPDNRMGLVPAGRDWGGFASMETNSVIVKILGEGGSDLPALVHVELFEGDMINSRSALKDGYADMNGYFSFSGLRDGTYRINVSVPGYLPQRGEVYVSHGEQESVRVTLHPVRDGGNLTANATTVPVQWLSYPEKARKRYLKARERFEKHEYKEAVKLLQEALEVDANFVYAYNQLGLTFWAMEQLDDAKQALRSAIRTDPKFLDAPLNLAQLLIDRKEYEEAMQVLTETSKTHPYRGEPYFLRARIHFASGDLQKAEEACREALKRDIPLMPEVHILLSNIYIRKGDAPKVAQELEAYLAIAPEGRYAKTAREKLTQLRTQAPVAQPSTVAGDAGTPGGDQPR